MVCPPTSTGRYKPRPKKPPRRYVLLTKLVKPCHFYQSTDTPKGEKLICGYDQSRRNRCKTANCPHFTPTMRYKIARHFGMVR